MRRAEMLAAAAILRAKGKPYFHCKPCGGPTVVDEDGCCVYCGVEAKRMPSRTPGRKKGRR